MPYTYNKYKTWEKVKSKHTMRICSLRRQRLKHEWNQMVWSVNNLRCGTAALWPSGEQRCPQIPTGREQQGPRPARPPGSNFEKCALLGFLGRGSGCSRLGGRRCGRGASRFDRIGLVIQADEFLRDINL